MKHPYLLATLLVSCVVSPLSQVWAGGSLAQMEAKRLTKEGWKAEPGMPSIEDQLESFFNMETENCKIQTPKYIYSLGQAQAATYTEAYDKAYLYAVTSMLQQYQSYINQSVSQSEDDGSISDANYPTVNGVNGTYTQDIHRVLHLTLDKDTVETQATYTCSLYGTYIDESYHLHSHTTIKPTECNNPMVMVSLYRIMENGQVEVRVDVVYEIQLLKTNE